MKKYLKISLLSLIILFVSIVNVYAASTATITATANETEVKAGDIVTITLSANCETGIEGIDSTLEYDTSKLEMQDLSVDTKFSNMSGTDESTGEYKLTVISNSEEAITNGTFATIKFKVLETVQGNDELTVKVSAIELGDSNDDWMQIEDKNVTLTIAANELEGDTNNPGEEDNNPEGDTNNPGEEDNNPEGDINNPGEEDNNPEGDTNNPGAEGNNPEDTNKPATDEKEDNTQADKVIDKAGVENYLILIIGAIVLVVIVSYKKIKQYKGI